MISASFHNFSLTKHDVLQDIKIEKFISRVPISKKIQKIHFTKPKLYNSRDQYVLIYGAKKCFRQTSFVKKVFGKHCFRQMLRTNMFFFNSYFNENFFAENSTIFAVCLGDVWVTKKLYLFINNDRAFSRSLLKSKKKSIILLVNIFF